jgi:prepilin peptidase CpaA
MHWFAWWPMLIVLLVATLMDLRSHRIPNWLVLPFFLAGIAVFGYLQGWHGIGQSLAGAGLGFFVYGLFFWMGGMGAGDVKLCAAIGAWIGPSQLFLAMIITALAGGIMALCWALAGGFFKELFKGTGNLLFNWKHRDPEMTLDNPMKRKMPYAPAIAIGTLLSFFAH